MSSELNGFYAGFFSGAGGEGLALFIIKDGVIAGTDAGGVLFDGTYAAIESGWSGPVKVKAPANVTLVQGVTTGPAGLEYEVPIFLPKNFLAEPYLSAQTPLGPVNFKLKRIRDVA